MEQNASLRKNKVAQKRNPLFVSTVALCSRTLHALGGCSIKTSVLNWAAHMAALADWDVMYRK